MMQWWQDIFFTVGPTFIVGCVKWERRGHHSSGFWGSPTDSNTPQKSMMGDKMGKLTLVTVKFWGTMYQGKHKTQKSHMHTHTHWAPQQKNSRRASRSRAHTQAPPRCRTAASWDVSTSPRFSIQSITFYPRVPSAHSQQEAGFRVALPMKASKTPPPFTSSRFFYPSEWFEDTYRCCSHLRPSAKTEEKTLWGSDHVASHLHKVFVHVMTVQNQVGKTGGFKEIQQKQNKSTQAKIHHPFPQDGSYLPRPS